MRFVDKYWVHLATAIGTLAAVATLLSKAEEIARSTDQVTTWTVYAGIGLVVLGSTSISLCYALFRKEFIHKNNRHTLYKSETSVEDSKIEDVEIIPDRQSSSLHRLSNRLYRPGNEPTFNIPSAHYKLQVEDKGDTYVGRELSIRVEEGSPLMFYEVRAYADGNAAAVSSFEEIDFRTQGLDDKNVEHLIVEDRALRKRVLVFFLPRIRPNEKSPREVSIEYKWPNQLWRIPDSGSDNFSIRLNRRVDVVQNLEFTIRVTNTLSDPNVEYLGEDVEGMSLAREEMVEGYYQCKYLVENAPAGGTEYLFRIIGD